MLQANHHNAAGYDAAKRAASSYPAAETRRAPEHKIILHVEQLLPRAEHRLRSIESLLHQALHILSDVFLERFPYFHSFSFLACVTAESSDLAAGRLVAPSHPLEVVRSCGDKLLLELSPE
jgi:hypothetical protein